MVRVALLLLVCRIFLGGANPSWQGSISRHSQRWSVYPPPPSRKRDYQVLNIDTKMFTFSPLGGLEAKWIIAGVVAAGAAVAVASKDKKTQTSYQQQQQVQQQQQQQQQKQEEPCPVTPQC